ncbi:hypothetical protein SLA2020_237900 [Shorea laevis]
MASHLYLLAVFLLFNTAATFTVSSKLVLEDGYEVTTVIDGHKLKINPHAVLALPGSSDLIVLDSSSSVFYTLSFPLSNESVPKKLSGDGVAGHSDGEASGARFNKPKSFAVDAKGNIYVADKNNHAIRKIAASGKVTTIAGGNSNKTGHHDGAAQDATFSDDFEVVFVPERCVLLVSDHGSQLVRLIILKSEDCVKGSHSALGAVTTWSVVLLLSCILGIIIGLAIRPYVIPHTARHQRHAILRDMEALPNQSGDTSTDLLLRPHAILRDMEALPNQSGDTSMDSLLRHQKRSC